MGGVNRLRMMIGANNFIAIDNGVQFSFKGCNKSNKVQIVLDQMDLYDVKFYKINMKNLVKCLIPVDEFDSIHFDQLVELFEQTTELYLHF